MSLKLSRQPRNDDELHLVIKAMFGVDLPRKSVCPGHVSPFDAVSHAYWGKEPGFAVWYASRGSGKSLALAVLGLTKALLKDIDVTILGGSMTQSKNVAEHMSKLLAYKNAPTYAVEKHIASEIRLHTQKTIRPLPASETTVRGPHPPLQLLDEVDEMEEKIYNSSLGQAMEQINTFGEVVNEYIVASSTWQNPIGCFTNVIDNARREGLPIFTWCWRELLQPHGWMSQRFIDQKRRAVSEQMWKTEYELNEPTGTSRAIDLDAVDSYFVEYPEPIRQEHAPGDTDDEWVWADPESQGSYVAGADWAKEQDKTVIGVIRVDVNPRRLVYLRRMNRCPYPKMSGAFDHVVHKYNAAALHDKTGVGNAVNDYLSDDAAHGFVMVGRKRSQMFVDYISDFEHGGYLLPKNVEMFYRSHRGATVSDVYAPHKWDNHTPDDLVMMALAHRAAGRTPPAVSGQGVPRDLTPRESDKQFHVKPAAEVGIQGLVTLIDDEYDSDVSVWNPNSEGVFNLF